MLRHREQDFLVFGENYVGNFFLQPEDSAICFWKEQAMFFTSKNKENIVRVFFLLLKKNQTQSTKFKHFIFVRLQGKEKWYIQLKYYHNCTFNTWIIRVIKVPAVRDTKSCIFAEHWIWYQSSACKWDPNHCEDYINFSCYFNWVILPMIKVTIDN